MRQSTLKRFVRLPFFDEHLELHRIDCLSSHRMLGTWEYITRFIEETPPEQVRPQRLLTGEDLQSLGFKPGPAFKEVLNSLEDAQLDGRVKTSDDAIKFVQDEFASIQDSPGKDLAAGGNKKVAGPS